MSINGLRDSRAQFSIAGIEDRGAPSRHTAYFAVFDGIWRAYFDAFGFFELIPLLLHGTILPGRHEQVKHILIYFARF